MYYAAGIDAGAYTSKLVILDSRKTVLWKAAIPSGAIYDAAARRLMDEACAALGISLCDVSCVTYTGIGSKLIRECLEAQGEVITDFTCQCKANKELFPQCRTIIDIGGTSTKVMRADEYGSCSQFLTSEKCASGSGRFMQIIAKVLQIDVSEISELSMQGTEPICFSTGCAVFAESDVITKIGEGVSAANILAGMNIAIGSKIASMVKRLGYEAECVMTGGGAQNLGLRKTVGDALGQEVKLAPDPVFTCAYGAAMLALSRMEARN